MIVINSLYKFIVVVTLILYIFSANITSAAGVRSIMMFGDSLTRGYGLPQKDGFVAQLANSVQVELKGIKLINFGVSGDTTAAGLARFEWSISPDIIAVVLALGGNDLLRGVSPKLFKDNLREILSIATKYELPILLIGLTAPENYGLDYKKEFDSVFTELESEFELILYPSFFSSLMENDSIKTSIQYLQEDRIHPNAKGVSKIVVDFKPVMIEFLNSLPGH